MKKKDNVHPFFNMDRALYKNSGEQVFLEKKSFIVLLCFFQKRKKTSFFFFNRKCSAWRYENTLLCSHTSIFHMVSVYIIFFKHSLPLYVCTIKKSLLIFMSYRLGLCQKRRKHVQKTFYVL